MEGEVKVTPRDNSYRVTYYRDGKRKRRQFKSFDEADAFKDALERGATDSGDDCSRLGGLFEYTERERWESKAAAKDLIRNGRQAVDFFGEDKLVAMITPKEIEKYRRELADRGNSVSTINRKMSALSAMLQEAEDMEIIDRKPRIKQRKEPVAKIRWVREREEDKIIEWLTKAGMRTEAKFVQFLIHTGLRVSKEAMSLKLENVRTMRRGDTQRYVLDILGKGAKQRSVPVNKSAEPLLLEMMAQAEAQGREKIWPLEYFKFERALVRACKCLGYEDITAHTLRHTFASRLISKGADIAKVQELMGHESIVTTRRYVHVDVTETVDTVDILG